MTRATGAGKRIAERQRELYSAITSLTREDFEHLRSDPPALKALFEKLGQQNILEAGSAYSVLVGRWRAVDPDLARWAPQALAALPARQSWRAILMPLAKTQPEKTLALLAPEQTAGQRKEIILEALAQLRWQSPAKARAWLETCTSPEDRKIADIAMAHGAVLDDPSGAVALAETMADRNEAMGLINLAARRAAEMGPGSLRQLASTPMPPYLLSMVMLDLIEQEPGMAVDLVMAASREGKTPEIGAGRAFRALAERDLEKALTKVGEMKGTARGEAISAIASQWLNRDAGAALTWLSQQPAADRMDMTRGTSGSHDSLIFVFSDLAIANPAAARTWADALPAGETRDRLQMELASTLARRGDIAQAVPVLAALGEAANPKTLGQLAQSWAQSDPRAAADWAIAQPAGPAQSRAIAGVVSAWANNDPQATQEWLTQFPPGEARDRSIAAYLMRRSAWGDSAAQQLAEFDQWFARIEDPWQRALVAQRSYWKRKSADPAEARAWLSSLRNVDAGLIHLTLRQDRP